MLSACSATGNACQKHSSTSLYRNNNYDDSYNVLSINQLVPELLIILPKKLTCSKLSISRAADRYKNLVMTR